MITVFGGSGFIGRYVVRALCKAGYRVRVATRRPHLALNLKVTGDVGQVQLVQANLRDRPSIDRATEGAEAVVNLVAILFEEGRQKFTSLHVDGARNVAESAAAAGAERFIQISGLGADEDASSRYARTKAEGENAVREAMPNATVLRPSVVFGEEDSFFNRFADMARFTPALPLFGGGRTRLQPVFAGDVADAVAAALKDDYAPGKTYELGGPRIYTFKELMRFIIEETDRKRLLVPLPYFAADFMGFFGEIAGALPFVEPFLTRDQAKLLRVDNVVGAGGEGLGTIEDLGVSPVSVEAIVPTYLERYRRNGQFHERRMA